MYSALLNETAVESLEETYALFTRICRDTATLQDMEQAYESKITAIRKFGPGKELLDLEMEDRNGTKVNLSSLKGTSMRPGAAPAATRCSSSKSWRNDTKETTAWK